MSIAQHNPFRLIGAFAPSSSRLAQAMIRYSDASEKILEVGAGTGAITDHLIRSKDARQLIEVVELYPMLARVLRKRFGHEQGVSIYCTDILKFQPAHTYDKIIVGLPFNSMLPETVEAIIAHLFSMAKDGAVLSFFEYKSMQKIVRPFLSQKNLEAFKKTRSVLERTIERFQFAEEKIAFNVPPAVVHYLKIDKKEALW